MNQVDLVSEPKEATIGNTVVRLQQGDLTGEGAMSMTEYSARRLKSARIKADQLKATGAKTVVTSCHNCVDGLFDLIRHYKLDMKVKQLVNLVPLLFPGRRSRREAGGSSLQTQTRAGISAGFRGPGTQAASVARLAL